MILVLWNLLRVAVCGLFLCSMCTWEKCILITYFVRSQLLIMLVKSLSSDFLICFSHLLLIVDLFFHLVLVSLALYLQDTTLLGVYRFRIVISSCWIDPFVIIKSLSRVVFLALKSIFFWHSSATLALYWLIFVQYIFLCPNCNLLMFLLFKVCLM